MSAPCVSALAVEVGRRRESVCVWTCCRAWRETDDCFSRLISSCQSSSSAASAAAVAELQVQRRRYHVYSITCTNSSLDARTPLTLILSFCSWHLTTSRSTWKYIVPLSASRVLKHLGRILTQQSISVQSNLAKVCITSSCRFSRRGVHSSTGLANNAQCIY